ncbi:MAG: hypothetical protein PHP01_04590, partial [Phycisphaerae bacterium]|nr:hypothetical protein [Phycisphaerae bacterium]
MGANRYSFSGLTLIILFTFLGGLCFAESLLCDCGLDCSFCGDDTPEYMMAILKNLEECSSSSYGLMPIDYPCFGGVMEIVLKQNPYDSCGYYYNGPDYIIEGSPFFHRLQFYLNFAGENV